MTLLFPVISGNKLNIYCIYIKNYTVVERGWCLLYWGAPRGEVSLDQFPCLVTPARGCLENACTAKLIQKRIHNLGGFKQFSSTSFFNHLFFMFHISICFKYQNKSFCAFLLPTANSAPPFLHSWEEKKMYLINWVLGGFTNIAIKQSQCFYCALDLKIEAALTAGSRRTYGKGPCLCLPVWR